MSVGPQVRSRFRVRGIVQGVGFRPFVHGLATRLRLGGFVLNEPSGVLIEVEGTRDSLDAFRRALRDDPPPLAVVESVLEEELAPNGVRSFDIRASDARGEPSAAVSPDVATCPDCLDEIRDVRARRHRYAFTNCTNCGPRFTLTVAIPYDRANTTMVGFEMCESCAREYEDASDRRFHAQPVACPACGPRLQVVDAGGTPVEGDPIAVAAEIIRRGGIVALKGLGGYHLACAANDESAVAELRRRKRREEKPFALMVEDLRWARRLAYMSPVEEATLTSRRRPIVLLRRRADAPVASPVAPGNRDLGLMLPYTPLHHLLLEELGAPIVATSGNLSDEPIAYRDDEAHRRLSKVADALLVHDRPIHVRCDDSVARVLDDRAVLIRRARGYAPEPLTVQPPFVRPVLGAGPELKHTFCLGTGERAILSHHIGDLEHYDAMLAFLEGVEHFEKLFAVEPEVVAHDLHPEYLSTKWALGLEGMAKVGVQHHHAHIAACLAENGRTDMVIGLALDGTGWGEDGAVWGCEVLACDLDGYARLGHLRYLPMPGAAMAIREPWRMAAVYLHEGFGDRAGSACPEAMAATRERWGPILQMARSGINSPPTSSAGRLFDAVAALCGVRLRVSYEGQAAAELEQVADPSTTCAYPCRVIDGVIDGVELVAAVAEDLARGRAVPAAAAAFHNGLSAALVSSCERARDLLGLGVVALSGGTWQNLLLLQRVRALLTEAGFEVLVHHRVPSGDGGIALGQAVVANARVM